MTEFYVYHHHQSNIKRVTPTSISSLMYTDRMNSAAEILSEKATEMNIMNYTSKRKMFKKGKRTTAPL